VSRRSRLSIKSRRRRDVPHYKDNIYDTSADKGLECLKKWNGHINHRMANRVTNNEHLKVKIALPARKGAPKPRHTYREGKPTQNVPVGEHIISLPRPLAISLKRRGHSTPSTEIAATRIWVKQVKGSFFLHLGDFDPVDT
jgi:hypothetical protein